MCWAPVRFVAKSTWSVSGKSCFRSDTEILRFSLAIIKASRIVFFLFLVSRCFGKSIHSFSFFPMFFITILSCNFLSVFAAVKHFDIIISSAEIIVKLHSFSNSINRLHTSSGLSFSDCLAQKKSRLWCVLLFVR